MNRYKTKIKQILSRYFIQQKKIIEIYTQNRQAIDMQVYEKFGGKPLNLASNTSRTFNRGIYKKDIAMQILLIFKFTSNLTTKKNKLFINNIKNLTIEDILENGQ